MKFLRSLFYSHCVRRFSFDNVGGPLRRVSVRHWSGRVFDHRNSALSPPVLATQIHSTLLRRD